MSSWSRRSDPSSPVRRALTASSSALATLAGSPGPPERGGADAGQRGLQLGQLGVDGLGQGLDAVLEVGRLHELLDPAGALVEGQLQRLEPPADLLRPHRLLQVAEAVGHRRLQGVEAAGDVVAPQRLLHPGELGDRPLQGFEAGTPPRVDHTAGRRRATRSASAPSGRGGR